MSSAPGSAAPTASAAPPPAVVSHHDIAGIWVAFFLATNSWHLGCILPRVRATILRTGGGGGGGGGEQQRYGQRVDRALGGSGQSRSHSQVTIPSDDYARIIFKSHTMSSHDRLYVLLICMLGDLYVWPYWYQR